jgi:hypothetical protein
MARDFKNQFSWSVSRDNAFKKCAREYYFKYYGSWTGWEADAPKRTREIYVLKQLKNRAIWGGQVVHDCIARTMQNLSRGVPLLKLEEILHITRNLMRNDFRNSRRKRYRTNPRGYCGLFEHEYERDISDEEWKETAEYVDHCLRNFYQSEHFEKLRRLGPKDFLEVEQFSSFHIDGVEVKIKLDLANWESGSVVIWDWKTGKSERDAGLSFQLACYALYAQQAYNVDPGRVITRRFDLNRGTVHESGIMKGLPEEIRAYILGSVKDMQGVLENVEENVAVENRFTKVERRALCMNCNFLKVCEPNL